MNLPAKPVHRLPSCMPLPNCITPSGGAQSEGGALFSKLVFAPTPVKQWTYYSLDNLRQWPTWLWLMEFCNRWPSEIPTYRPLSFS